MTEPVPLRSDEGAEAPVLVFAPPAETAELETALRFSHFRVMVGGAEGVGDAGVSTPTVAAVVSDAVPASIDLCRRLAATLPVVLVSSESDFTIRLAAARAGVRTMLRRPVDPVELLHFLEEANPAVQRERTTVVLVDDDELVAELNAAVLRSADIDVEVVTDPAKAIDAVERIMPDLVLLDLRMPGVDGVELAATIRLLPHLVAIPLVFLSAERSAARQSQARSAGAEDFIPKPVDPKKLIAQVKMRAVRARTLRAMCERDGLTGLLGRTRFHERVDHATADARLSGATFSLAIIDVDHFKGINDRHGHLIGDQVLRTLASVLTGSLRQSDVVGRCGGEEFGVLMPGADAAQAHAVIDRLRQSFVDATANTGLRVTFSAGVVDSRTFGKARDLLQAADQAMYSAKVGGRNRVARYAGEASAAA